VDDAVLEISVPADVESLRSVRLVATDAAARAGFDVAEIEDIRVAVNELCRTCLETSTETTNEVLVRFYVAPGRVAVRGFARLGPAQEPMHLSRVSQVLLAATVDDFDLSTDEMVARFSLVKQRESDRASSLGESEPSAVALVRDGVLVDDPGQDPA
jgi:hypothetical protein